jgi:ubiquinone/menaquinone biosynthesis C-methylase UbiE
MTNDESRTGKPGNSSGEDMDYSDVTEVPGNKISAEALEMMCLRYGFAGDICAGKDVLEVACGAGQGLGLLARKGRSIVGGDYTERLLQMAREHYGTSMKLVRLDAHQLPFHAGSFDVVLLYEAIYYLANAERFVRECRRVLRDGGVVLICSVNREWPDFSPSPLSTRYYSAEELADLLSRSGFLVEIRGAFQVSRKSPKDVIVSFVKRAARELRLIPKTMKGKEFLKRVFLGKLVPMPREIPGNTSCSAGPEPTPSFRPLPGYKVIFAVGYVKSI